MNQDEKQDIQNSLTSYGLNFNDFDFKEKDLTDYRKNTIYSKVGEIIVTYKPNGISKKYATGMSATWPADLDTDIRTNFYKTRR